MVIAQVVEGMRSWVPSPRLLKIINNKKTQMKEPFLVIRRGYLLRLSRDYYVLKQEFDSSIDHINKSGGFCLSQGLKSQDLKCCKHLHPAVLDKDDIRTV